MRRRIVLFIIITLCFLLQTTLFKTLSFANISPNLLIIAVSSFGFMRGKKEGLWVGFFCGLLIDIFCGNYIGLYALISIVVITKFKPKFFAIISIIFSMIIFIMEMMK